MQQPRIARVTIDSMVNEYGSVFAATVTAFNGHPSDGDGRNKREAFFLARVLDDWVAGADADAVERLVRHWQACYFADRHGGKWDEASQFEWKANRAWFISDAESKRAKRMAQVQHPNAKKKTVKFGSGTTTSIASTTSVAAHAGSTAPNNRAGPSQSKGAKSQ
jgi:hypothetical protein